MPKAKLSWQEKLVRQEKWPGWGGSAGKTARIRRPYYSIG
jgi:hypothetical protein